MQTALRYGDFPWLLRKWKSSFSTLPFSTKVFIYFNLNMSCIFYPEASFADLKQELTLLDSEIREFLSIENKQVYRACAAFYDIKEILNHYPPFNASAKKLFAAESHFDWLKKPEDTLEQLELNFSISKHLALNEYLSPYYIKRFFILKKTLPEAGLREKLNQDLVVNDKVWYYWRFLTTQFGVVIDAPTNSSSQDPVDYISKDKLALKKIFSSSLRKKGP